MRRFPLGVCVVFTAVEERRHRDIYPTVAYILYMITYYPLAQLELDFFSNTL